LYQVLQVLQLILYLLVNQTFLPDLLLQERQQYL
jgi:hypothetical protein